MRRKTAIAAATLLACFTAACAETPAAPPVKLIATATPPAETPAPLQDPDAGASPLDSCSGPVTALAARSDCAALAAELHGLKTVTVEFSDRYQAVAVGIQIYTMSWITHDDFVLPDGRLLGATPFGVRIRKWTPAIHTVRYTFKADAEKVLGFALTQLGRPYDYVGLTGSAMKISLMHQPGAWFCSALVEAAALKGGVDLSGMTPFFTSPAKIEASRLLTRLAPDQAVPAAQPTLTVAAYQPPRITAALVAAQAEQNQAAETPATEAPAADLAPFRLASFAPADAALAARRPGLGDADRIALAEPHLPYFNAALRHIQVAPTAWAQTYRSELAPTRFAELAAPTGEVHALPAAAF